MNKTRIAIAGATGNIGRELVRLMEERQEFANAPILLASSVSAGEFIPYEEGDLQVRLLKDYEFKDIDAIIFATPKEVSEVYVSKAEAVGVSVVDLSTFMRADENTLMYFDGMTNDVSDRTRVASLPSVASLQIAQVLSVLEKSGVVLRSASTTVMCPVSMHGTESMEELFAQSAALLGGAGAEESMPENFSAQIAYNVIPHVGNFQGAHTDAEVAIIMEANRALTQPVPLMATCVYVPTFVGMSQSITVDIEGGLDVEAVRKALDASDIITVIDNPEKKEYSTPFGSAETDKIYVSRIREDMLAQGKLQLWVTSDNLRMAALSALNVVKKMSK